MRKEFYYNIVTFALEVRMIDFVKFGLKFESLSCNMYKNGKITINSIFGDAKKKKKRTPTPKTFKE